MKNKEYEKMLRDLQVLEAVMVSVDRKEQIELLKELIRYRRREVAGRAREYVNNAK